MAKSIKAGPKADSKPAARKTKKEKKEPLSPEDLIVRACESSLTLLTALNLDYQLQSEINWCLGSYHNDHNPVGLYQMAERALVVFREEQAKKTKGVTPKLIAEIERAIKNRR